MNKNQLAQLVEAEVKRLVESSIGTQPPTTQQNISGTDGEMSMGSKLMQMPGHPSAGNMGTFGRWPMNNESREALKNWVRVAKKVMEKYPDPATIPADMKKMLELLGNKFDQNNQIPNSGVGYGNM